MNATRPIEALVLALGLAVALLLPTLTAASTSSQPQTASEETSMSPSSATGPFTVKLAPQPLHHESADSKLGRMSLDKEYEGDLVGTATGEMLSAITDTKGSAGYVAIERFVGSLAGKSGTFVLQHSSTMAQGEPRQSITVVPDSGTGELVGLTGSMTIEITDGKHFYHFDYSLP